MASMKFYFTDRSCLSDGDFSIPDLVTHDSLIQ
jgi:hypothetical protein